MHYEQNRSGHPRRHNNTNNKIYLHHLLFIFCITFLLQLTISQVEAKPMRILRLEADQMREILRYIYSQEGREGKQPMELEEEGNEKPGKVKETNMPDNKNPALSEEKGEKEMESDAKGKLDDANPWKAINLSTPVVYTLEDQSEKKKHGKRKEEGKCQLEAGQATQLQKKVRHFLHSQLKHIWTDQFVQVLGMNVSIADIRARHVRAPHARLQPICSPNGQFLRLVASLTGGSLTLRANYRSVYRTVRTGNLRVRLGQFRAKVGEGAEEERGKCAVDVGRLEVRFRQRLLEEVDQAVADQLRDRLRHLICNRLPVFLRQESRR